MQTGPVTQPSRTQTPRTQPLQMQPSRIVLPPASPPPAPRLPPHAGPGIGRRLFGALCLRPLVVCGRGLLFLLPLAALAVTVLYLRIMYSPIAIDFLAEPIERALNADLGGMSARISGAVLHRSERGGVEVRLRRLVLHDSRGGEIADAAWAGVEISMRALMAARVAPVRIDLIEPRIQLAADAQGRVSISVGAHDPEREASDAPPAAAASPGPHHQPAGALPTAPPAIQLDAGRAVADIMARLRQTGDPSDHLRTIGMRNATLVIAGGERETVLRVPLFHIDLRQKQRQQSITGTARIAGGDEPWALGFRIEPAEGQAGRGIRITADLAGLTPSTLADLPLLRLLRNVDAPLTATGVLDLEGDGTPVGWHLAADLGQGRIGVPGARGTLLERGHIEVRYDPATQRLELLPSPVELEGARLTLTGVAAAAPDGGWRFEMASRNGVIGSPAAPLQQLPVQQLLVKGGFGGDRPAVMLEEIVARLAGATFTGTGRIGGESGFELAAQGTPLPVATWRKVLPRGLCPGCDAALDRLPKGVLTLRSARLAPAAPQGEQAGSRVSLVVEGQDVEIELAPGLPPLEASRALLRVDGTALELTVPEAQATLAGSRRIQLRGGRATIADLEAVPPVAEIAVRAQGQVPAFLDFLDREPLRLFKGSGPPHPGMDGKVDSQLRIVVPLSHEARLADARFEGRTRITDGRIKDVVGSHDISGATLTIDAGEQALELKGELLVAGVVVKAAGHWQHVGADRRPPTLELTTRLDSAYRVQLGLDLEHMLAGEVPVRVVLQKDSNDQLKTHLWADLTPADITLADINWKKPAGRPARLEFDVAKGQAAKSLELQNFKLVGENVAIDGWVGIGPDSKAREYYFPEFSINVVTNLSVRGKLRQQDKVWEVVARGKTYDARDLFRSFYAFGADGQPVPKHRPGIDLEAEVETVLGMNDTTLRNAKIVMQQRAERLVGLELTGTLEGGRSLSASLKPQPRGPRILKATAADAGQALKLIGFYSSMSGGAGELSVNLDGRGAAEKSGEVRIRRFQLLGDPIVAEVLQGADGTRPAIEQGTPARRRIVREQFDFDQLTASFAVGNGQMALEDAIAKGPLVGASLRGKIDFRSRRMQLGGTYVPLSGINRALSGIPLFGPLLTGPRGEGIFGITFAVEGPMAEPNVIVNPFSLVTPGLIREIFQMAPESPSITPKQEQKAPRGPGPQVRSSPPGEVRATGDAPPVTQAPRDPELLDGWSATSKRRQ